MLLYLLDQRTALHLLQFLAPCGLRVCKNRPALFPGRMPHKAIKPGSVCPILDFLSVYVVLLTRAPFALLFCVICVFCLLVVLVRLSVPVQVIDWKDSEMTYNVLMETLNPTHSLTLQFLPPTMFTV